MDVLYIAAGLALLTLGGERLVRASVAISERMRLSALLVSVVVVGFGTSSPELMVALQATLHDAPDIALGNIVGSTIYNTLLILGVAALITAIPVDSPAVRRDILVVLTASFLLAILSFAGIISRFIGLAMIAALAAYLSYAFWEENGKKGNRQEKKLQHRIKTEISVKDMPLWQAIPQALASLLFLIAGAHLLVEGATALAAHAGIPEAIIGLTIVTIGTTLPELATAVIAARRKHTDIVIGNILGSNIFNILGILGMTAIVKPIPFAGHIAEQDVWIMLAVSALLAAVALSGRKISRIEGGIFLLLYTGYLLWLYLSGGKPTL